MTPLRHATLQDTGPGWASFSLPGGWACRVMLIAGGIGRFQLTPPEGHREPRTWALDPAGEFPLQGRLREGLFMPDPTATCEADALGITLTGDRLRARITLKPFGVAWDQRAGQGGDLGSDPQSTGDWQFCCADRASYAYATHPRSGQLSHWQQRDALDQYFGLGDKTGPLDKHGRRLRTRALDALGYNAETSDPLYKHWPFFLGRRADTGSTYGLYYDTLAECTFDFGQEHDHYHGPYRTTDIADGDLDGYVFAGPDLRGALARFVAAIGGTALPPRWSLGYANTAMALADHPDAQARIRAFLAQAEAEHFPLSSFHFGSGYTSRGKQRYVFTWNTDKFPDPQGLLQAFAAAGVRTVANLKPCLLDDHPAFATLAAAGAFVREPVDGGTAPTGTDGTTTPCLDAFWDGWGAHLDFSRPADAAWWQTQFQQQVLAVGIDAGWNDNNEYEIWGEGARVAGFGEALPMARARPLQALLMTRATFDAQARARPSERVYTVTRAGPPGIQRYAQTWSGDNTTGWHTLRWNQRMALTMGLSGMFNVGHDIGGFHGPVPSAELLQRWTQACCLLPRMVMNSWKADGSVNSPWLHAEATAPIRQAIALRLQLMPYLYTQMWLATRDHQPVLRPLFFDFGDDPRCWEDNDQMMVGPDLLAAPVFEPGARTRTLYLPAGANAAGWFDFHTGQFHAAGQTVTVDAPLDRLPLFVRAGALLPTTDSAGDLRLTEETTRALRYYPAPGQASHSRAELFEDDGLTPLAAGPDVAKRTASTWAAPARLHRFEAQADLQHLRLTATTPSGSPLPGETLRLVLPPGEARTLVIHAVQLHLVR